MCVCGVCVCGEGGTTDLGEPAGVGECGAIRRRGRCSRHQPRHATQCERCNMQRASRDAAVAQRAAIIATCNNNTQRTSRGTCNTPVKHATTVHRCNVRPATCTVQLEGCNMQQPRATCNMQRTPCSANAATSRNVQPRNQNDSRPQTKQHRGARIYRHDATDGTQQPYSMRHATCNSTVKHAPHNSNVKRATGSMPCAAYNLQHATHTIQRERCNKTERAHPKTKKQQAANNTEPRCANLSTRCNRRHATCTTKHAASNTQQHRETCNAHRAT